MATALGAPEQGGRPALERLTAFVGDRQLLLLLDNFEHVLGAAPLVTALLRACPHVTALVTSRAPLRLTGEQEFAVPPLTLPGPTDPAHPLSWERGAQSEAVALFVERARGVAADFALTDEHAPAVAALCRRLDGLPLAIELAAAHTRLLPPRALLARLEGPSGDTALGLLADGPRDAAARQRTLRATIAWSYDLLPPAPQAVFRRLGVFAGGCTLEAAEAVAAGADRGADPGLDVLSAVRSLVASSLVRREELPDGEVRLVLLRTIREFALEALASCGEALATRRAHAAYVLALAEQAAPHVQGAAQARWLRRLETEHDNLRAALRWLADAGEAERGLRVSNALLWFWFNRGHWREGRAWLERFLEAAEDRPRGDAPGRPPGPPATPGPSRCGSGRGRCSAPGGSPRGRETTRSPASGTRRVSRRRPARATARRWGGRGTAWGRSRPSPARTPRRRRSIGRAWRSSGRPATAGGRTSCSAGWGATPATRATTARRAGTTRPRWRRRAGPATGSAWPAPSWAWGIWPGTRGGTPRPAGCSRRAWPSGTRWGTGRRPRSCSTGWAGPAATSGSSPRRGRGWSRGWS